MNALVKAAACPMILAVLAGCVSRAPTDCELDRRSGLYPSSFCDKDAAADPRDQPALLSASSGSASSGSALGSSASGGLSDAKPATFPIREQPVVAKIWVRDQVLDGGNWMQGTWLFVEVQPSRWSGESVALRADAGKRLGGRRTATRPANRTRASHSASAQSFAVEPGESATRSERGGRQ